MEQETVTVEVVFRGHSMRAQIPLDELNLDEWSQEEGLPSPLEQAVIDYVLSDIAVFVETDE